jgi:hypothetical protein
MFHQLSASQQEFSITLYLASSATRCLIYFFSFTFGSKNNNILQLGTILNTGTGVFKIFFQIFGMAGLYFSKF